MIGTTVKQYKILQRIGAGGMGVVYKAEDTRLGRIVALKFLPPYALDNEEDRARFLIEAQSAAALDHPNICTIHEIGDANEHQFIVMAFVDGPSLKERLKDGAIDPGEAINIATQVTSGLSKAHEKGIIHRDIKPANILLAEGGLVKVCDFGLAKSSISKKVTRTGSTIGTAAYMSPEQARSEVVDQRTDIWSVGVILYEMLSGKPPFVADHEAVVIYAILNDEYPPLEEKRPGLPLKLYEIVRKALAHKSADRYATMEDLRRDLKVVASQVKGPSTTSGTYPVVTASTPAPKPSVDTVTTKVTPSKSPVDTVTTKIVPPQPIPKKELSGERKKSSSVLYVAVGALTLVAVLALVWFNKKPSVEAPVEETAAVPAPSIAPPEAAGDAETSTKTQSQASGQKLPTVAVLYMENLSGDKSEDYFAAGMTEDIIHELAGIKKLKVLSRYDVLPFKGQTLSVSDMGKQLKADYILEGAVRRDKKQLRLTAHLHRVADQDLQWSLRYDRPANDVFAVQSEIADSVARALAVTLAPEEKSLLAKTPTANVEAYDHYLRGRHALERRSEEDNEQAEKSFRRAISLDKNFLAAQTELARTLLQQPEWGWDDDPKLLTEAEQLLQRAVADSMSMSHLYASGLLLQLRNDLQGTIRLRRRAVQLTPEDPDAHYYLGVALGLAAQHEEAVKELRRTVELKPDHVQAYRWLGTIAHWTGKTADAHLNFRKALEYDPDAISVLQYYGNILIELGDFAGADTHLNRAIALRPKSYNLKAAAGRSALFQGRSDAAVKLLDEAAGKSPSWNRHLLLGQAQLIAGKKPASEKSWREAARLISIELAQYPDDPAVQFGQVYIRCLLGEIKDPNAEYKRLASNTKKTPDPTERYYYMAAIDANCGNEDLAIENLERVVKMNVLAPAYIAADPSFAKIVKNPRFLKLVGKAPSS